MRQNAKLRKYISFYENQNAQSKLIRSRIFMDGTYLKIVIQELLQSV